MEKLEIHYRTRDSGSFLCPNYRDKILDLYSFSKTFPKLVKVEDRIGENRENR